MFSLTSISNRVSFQARFEWRLDIPKVALIAKEETWESLVTALPKMGTTDPPLDFEASFADQLVELAWRSASGEGVSVPLSTH